MAQIRARNLARDWRADPARCREDLREALRMGREGRPGGIASGDFSLRDLAATFIVDRHGEPVGAGFLEEAFAPNNPGSLQEAMSAVDSTAFANITGQLVINALLTGYQQEEFVATRLVRTVPTKLSGEKIPGVNRLSDQGDDLIVREGQPYPHFGFGEQYVETPATTKRGFIVPVTKEAIYFDLTGQVMQRAGEVGEILGLNKEKRLLDLIAGVDNNYKRNGTEFNTFDTGTNWTNDFYANDLVDWNAIDTAEQAFADLLDPDTGEPILMSGRTLLTVPHKMMVGQRILTATETRETTNTNTLTVAGNPLAGMGISAAYSRQLYRRLVAADGLALDSDTAQGVWFYGDFRKAFGYMENWPITVVQSPLNSEAEFNQDIVLRYKASERGVAAVLEPRAIQRHRAAAASSSSGA